MTLRRIDTRTAPSLAIATYIWLDGTTPTQEEPTLTQQTRAKTRVIEVWDSEDGVPVPNLPNWSFDGSSTGQATGQNSDCILKPVHYVLDPFQKEGLGFLVLCEVLDAEGQPHVSNTRSRLTTILNEGAAKTEGWFGFEQEYFLYYPDGENRGATNGLIMGWPGDTEPAPQGPYYCGTGAENVVGREIAMRHLRYCMEAGLLIYGLNAEVALGQWEFQVGHRGLSSDTDEANALIASDHLWLARYILDRVAEAYGLAVSYDPKPRQGDWNGSGLHTNFSTWATREPNQGRNELGIPKNIATIIDALGETHKEHMAVYGVGNEARMTGEHETCNYNEFEYGDADRGASIRIPRDVMTNGCGYIEDRRPAANADPYLVTRQLLATSCGFWISVPPSALLN